MANQVVKIALDASDLTSNAKAMLQTLSQQQTGVLNLAQAMVKFNAQGDIVRQKLQGVAADGSAFEATLKKVGNAWDFAGGRALAAANTFKTAQQAQQANINAQRASDAQTAGSRIRGGPQFAAFGKLDPAAANQVEGAIRRIQKAIEEGKVSLTNFEKIYMALLNDPKANLGNLTAGEEKVAAALRTISGEFKDLGNSAEAPAKKLFISFDGVVRLIEVQVFRRLFRGFVEAVEGGVEEAGNLSIAIGRIEAISGEATSATATWRAEVARLSATYGIAQDEIAKGAYEAYQTGAKSAAEATIVLDEALKLSTVTTLTTSEATQTLGQITEAYGETAANASKYSNILFETFSHSRTTAQQFSTEMSRLAGSAAGAGVSFIEVSAAVDTLQQKGIKTSDAIGLVNNVLLALQHPTKELQDEFTKLGVTGGDSFLALEGGFGGVLQYFSEQSREGNKNLGSLAEGFQSLQRRINVTGNAFKDYGKTLADLKNSNNAVNDATNKVADTIGIKFQTELNNVKEYFVNEWSTNVLIIITTVESNFVSLTTIVKTLVPALEVATAAFVALKTASLIAPSIVFVQQAITGVVLETNAATAATKAYGAAVAGWTGPIIAGLAIGGLIEQYTVEPLVKGSDTIEHIKATALEKEQARSEEYKKLYKSEADAQIKSEQDVNDKIKGVFDEKYQAALGYEANIVRALDNLKDAEIRNLEQVNEALKASSTGLEDSIKKNIEDLSKQAEEAKKDVETSQKAVEDLGRKSADLFTANKLKFANPGQALGSQGPIVDDQRDEIIRKRITDLSNEARKYAAEGTKDGIEQARKLYDEIEHLQSEMFDNETNLRKKAFDEEVKQHKAQPSGYDPVTGQTRYTFTVQTAEYERKIKDIVKERIAAEEAFQVKEVARQKAKEAEAEKEKERLKVVSDLLQQAAKFSVYNPSGNVKQQYIADPKKAGDDINFIENELKKHTMVTEQNFAIFKDLENKKVAVVKEVQAQIAAEEAKQIEVATGLAKKRDKDAIDNLQKRIDEQRAIIKSAQDDLAQAAGVIKQKITPQNVNNAVPGTTDRAKELKAREEEFETAQKGFDALQAQRAGPQNIAAAAANLKERADAYRTAAEAYTRAATGFAPENTRLGLDKNQTEKDRLDVFTNSVNKIADAANQAAAAKESLNAVEEQANSLNAVISKLPEKFIDISDGSRSMANIVDAQLKRLGDSPNLANLLLEMGKIYDFTKVGVQNPGQEPGTPPPGHMMGKVKYYDDGGFTDFVPRGSDTIPAMLAKGESVVTADATRDWAPLIEAMNSGVLSTRSNGGSHPSFGDITINVQGGDTSDKTIREIGTGLRRALRRGLVTLE